MNTIALRDMKLAKNCSCILEGFVEPMSIAVTAGNNRCFREEQVQLQERNLSELKNTMASIALVFGILVNPTSTAVSVLLRVLLLPSLFRQRIPAFGRKISAEIG